MHAVYDSGVWTREIVDTDGTCDSALALDSTGTVHMIYRTTAGELKYRTSVSGVWKQADVVATFTDFGCYGPGRLSLAVATGGSARVVYAGGNPDYGLVYATNQSGSWSVSTIDSIYVTSVSSAVDANGKVHVAYADNTGRLNYANDTSGAWAVGLIEGEGSPDYPSLAIDSAGKSHVSYFNRSAGEIRYATNLAGAWRILRIDAIGSEAPYTRAATALALDSQTKVHISYFDNLGPDLKYATNR